MLCHKENFDPSNNKVPNRMTPQIPRYIHNQHMD